jgi:hypothetical protein
MGAHVEGQPLVAGEAREFLRRIEVILEEFKSVHQVQYPFIPSPRTSNPTNNVARTPTSAPLEVCAHHQHAAAISTTLQVNPLAFSHSHMLHLPPNLNLDPPPPAGLFIPDIKPNAGAQGWRTALAQWENPNPTTGMRALRDWPRSWYTGPRRLLFSSKRHLRKLVADGYN